MSKPAPPTIRHAKIVLECDSHIPRQARKVAAARKHLESIYLDWVNNFLRVETFAEYYGISATLALSIIEHFRAEEDEQ